MTPITPILCALSSRDASALSPFLEPGVTAESLFAQLDAYRLTALSDVPIAVWEWAITEAKSMCGPESLEIDVPLFDNAGIMSDVTAIFIADWSILTITLYDIRML